jgi:hypothetical protein
MLIQVKIFQNIKKFFILFLYIFFVSCSGYHIQGSQNPWESLGIKTAYIDIVTNNSLRAGLEVPFTSAFVKQFSRGNKLKIVSDEKEADVTIKAVLQSYSSSISSMTTVPSITQDPLAKNELSSFQIAIEYVASAAVTVSIINNSTKKVLASQNFTRQKNYPANNRYGPEGTTSVLINDSELQFALNEIARLIADDAYDLMLEVF